jgi:hypothetical protein
MGGRTIVLVAAASLSTAWRAGAQHPLVTLPLDDPVYVQLDGLVHQGCTAARPSIVRPYTVALVREAVEVATGDGRCRGPVLDVVRARFAVGDGGVAGGPPAGVSGLRGGLAAYVRLATRRNLEFRPLWRDVRPDSEGDPTAVGLLAGRVTWEGSPGVVAVLEGYAQSDRRNDPTVRSRGFRQTRGVVDVSEGYVAGRAGPVTVVLGRGSEAWLGEDRESLMLSANGPPLDRIRAVARWSRFEVHAVFAALNDVVLTAAQDQVNDAGAGQRYHRFFAAHAVSFRPAPNWELTLGETAVIPRRGGGVDVSFLNPVMPYLVAENDTARAGGASDNNNLTAFGAVRVAAGRASLAAELLVDDIQIDARDRRRVPDQLGWRVAGTVGVPVGVPASAGLEYRRIDSYTYMRQSYAEAYQAYNQPLGSELGPDADQARVSGEVWANGRLRLSGGLARWWRGALRIDQRPGVSAVGHAGEPYPAVSVARPVPQRTWLGDGALQFLDQWFPVTIRLEVARIDDLNNQPAPPVNEYRVTAVATYRFRYP